MTSVGQCKRAGRLDYWRLSPAERRGVRRIERTSRATGDRRLDAIALGRLRRAVRRSRWLAPFGRFVASPGAAAEERLARLGCTLRHPSRTGVPIGPRVTISGPGTS